MHHTFMARLAIALIVAFSSVSSAATITYPDEAVLLSSLLGGDTLVVGDKTFGDFTYIASGDMPPATGVNVIPLISDGDYGIRFQGGFIDTVGDGASDSLITFSVTAPGEWIIGANLAANPTATDGVGSITETFLPEQTTALISVTSGVNLVDSVMFDAPVQTLNVQKDILLLAEGAPATLSFVDQSFPQVPEPTSGLLCSLGLLGFLGLRRRRVS